MSKRNRLSPEEKKLKKKAGGKKALKILAGVLIFIILFDVASGFIGYLGMKSNIKKSKEFPEVGCSLKYENVSDGVWNIYSDKDLKIVQLTDIHIGGGWVSTGKDMKALNAVAAMLNEEKPDFVIVTGDVAYPVPFQSGTLNNKHGAYEFAELMETLGIYWTVGYGNHDTEAYSRFTREEITDFYSSNYPHCLVQPGPEDVDGCGNQIFNIVNKDGIVTRMLFVLDSHSYIDGDFFGIKRAYDNIHENQVAWYKEAVLNATKANAETLGVKDAETVASSLFFHIPLTEYDDAWKEYLANGRNDTENVTHIYGTTGENGNTIFCGINQDDLFETVLELGSTDTIFCGHDHLNNFAINYKGINLIYGYSIDYLAYIGISKVGTQRGCTVITYADDGSIEWHPESYYQDKYVSYYEKETVEMQDLDDHK